MDESSTGLDTSGLQSTVAQSPNVIRDTRSVQEQLKKEALDTIQMMETARGTKGNFCLTLGSGPDRALLFVSPDTTDSSRVDYYLLTAGGMRRLRLWKQTDPRIPIFEQIVHEAVSSNPNLTTSEYREKISPGGVITYGLNLLSINHPENQFVTSRITDSSLPQYNPEEEIICQSTDKAMHQRVLENSLHTVQAPTLTQQAQAQGQIATLQGLKKGLK